MRVLKFSQVIRGALPRGGKTPFDSLVRKLSANFKRRGAFFRLTANDSGHFDWPKEHGVYVVRRRSGGRAVYVGIAGRLKNSGRFEKKSESGLNKRAYRTTPYRFCSSTERFQYNPIFSSSKKKGVSIKTYRSSVSLKSLVVDCFTFGARDRIAPAALESLLLQVHIEQHGRLPLANRQF